MEHMSDSPDAIQRSSSSCGRDESADAIMNTDSALIHVWDPCYLYIHCIGTLIVL